MTRKPSVNANVPENRGDRRDFLGRAGCLGFMGLGASTYARRALAAELMGGHPLAPRPGHFPPKAKSIIFVFLTGGFSHVDTFDPKPRLAADQDQPLGPGFALGSPFKFERRGESGLEISELFPCLGNHADDLCVIRSLHTDIVEHFQATLAMHTGSATIPMPSLGSWLSLALGTENPNLPSYVVLCEHLPYAGSQVWDSSFLPPDHQGTRIIPGPEPIADLVPKSGPGPLAELEARMLRDIDERYARLRPGDLRPRARLGSFEIARGMMQTAPAIFEVAAETNETRALYGIEPGDRSSFGWQCLVARRMVESGARVVELIDTGSSNNWDAHGDMRDHLPKAQRVDRALAALLTDLKRRGLLQETLIVGCTEFGRTPWAVNKGEKGRSHHADAFSCFLAGAGVRGGMAYGRTDDHGVAIVQDPVHVHDFHATILHLMGIDHERLTYRYAGRDFRLTDVDGNVIRAILA